MKLNRTYFNILDRAEDRGLKSLGNKHISVLVSKGLLRVTGLLEPSHVLTEEGRKAWQEYRDSQPRQVVVNLSDLQA